MEKSFFEQMGGTYYQEGDYLLPNLTPPESVPVGIWSKRRRRYLKLIENLSIPLCFSAASWTVICLKLINKRRKCFLSL